MWEDVWRVWIGWLEGVRGCLVSMGRLSRGCGVISGGGWENIWRVMLSRVLGGCLDGVGRLSGGCEDAV